MERSFPELHSCSAHDENGVKEHRDWVNQEWTVRVTDLTEKGVIGKVVER